MGPFGSLKVLILPYGFKKFFMGPYSFLCVLICQSWVHIRPDASLSIPMCPNVSL